MILRWAALAILTCAAAPAAAQDLSYSFAPTLDCLAENGEKGEAHQCFGAAANACMEATDGGYSTFGMSGCLDAELADWDRRLNDAYRLLMTHSKAQDAEGQAEGWGGPSQAEALRQMQRAWIVFRDASCAYERSTWGTGTGAGPATLSCLLDRTATQAWSLEQSVAASNAATCNHEGCSK